MMKNMTNKERYKKFRSAVILFLFGQFFYILSIASSISTFKFLPRWLTLLILFTYIAFVFIFISLFKVRKRNTYFFYAFITFVVLLAVTFVNEVCLSSTDGYYLSLTRAFSWSKTFLQTIMYFYFFQGAYCEFKEKGLLEKYKKTKIMCIVFASSFASYVFLTLFSKLSFISSNIIANRVFYYGLWLFSFVIQVYIFAICVNVLIGTIKLGKGVNDDEEEKQTTEASLSEIH